MKTEVAHVSLYIPHGIEVVGLADRAPGQGSENLGLSADSAIN